MAKFRVYNIQLLPVDDEVKEVGSSGYRRLFSMLRDLNKKKIKAREEGQYHFRQSDDTFIGPHSFSFPAGHVHGVFLRYRKTEAVNELGSGRALFRAGPKIGVTDEQELVFVFDTKNHLFAIESPSFMPPAQVFGDFIAAMLAPIAEAHFPEHELTVNVLSKKTELEKVFGEAVAYSVIDLNMTFRNGHDTEELLRDLKDTHTKNLSVRASAGKGGKMTGLPNFLRGMLLATATGLGQASISYYVPSRTGKQGSMQLVQYESTALPITFQLNRTSATADNPQEFADRILAKIQDLEDDIEKDLGDEDSSES